MTHTLRICKRHWNGEHNEHWGRLDSRQPFSPPDTLPQFAPDAAVVSRHLRVELHLDPDHQRAWGTTTHVCEVRMAEASEVVFDAIALEITAAKVDGHTARFVNDGKKARVTLPRPVPQGKRFTVEIAHSVERPTAGLYFTNPDPSYPNRFRTVWSQGQDEDTRYYLPCLDSPHFKQTTEALLYVPSGWFALSNGDRVARKVNAAKGEDLWHYRMELPYSTYLFSVVAGEFAEHTEKKGPVEVRWYVQRGREHEGRNAFGDTSAILKFLAEFTGMPYPSGQYTQIAVPDFIFGGMENFTVTTQTDLTLHDDRAHLDFSSNGLVSHEAAHTWFGNLVTARSWAHAWLHESFATYCESLWLNHAEGPEEHDYQLLREAEDYFQEDAHYQRPLVTYRYQQPIDMFDNHLYPGGAVRLRHLHALLGDAPFRGALRRYLETHRLGVAETVDLARAVEVETGLNWDWWFEQWIHSAGYPTLEAEFSWDEKEKLAKVTVKQTRTLHDEAADKNTKGKRWFRLPLKLMFQVGTRQEVYPVTVEGEVSRFFFRLGSRPRMVLLDPDFDCPVKKLSFDKPQDLLLHELTQAPGVVSRLEAAERLAEKPDARVVAALGKALKREKFWGVQQRIARALGRIGGAAAREALLDGLRVPHPKARREVVSVLGWFREDPQVAAALLRLVKKGDPSGYVEGEAARALGRCRAPGAAEALAALLDRDAHTDAIRVGVYDGLAELGDEAVLPLVSEGMRQGSPPLARVAAIRAAGELGWRHLRLRPNLLEALAQVAEVRDNPSASFRPKLAAIRALQRMGDLAGLPVLRRIVENETDGRVIRLAKLAIEALRRAADKPAELHSLRTDLDLVGKENKSLRERVETLEKTKGPKTPLRPGGSRRSASGKKTPRRR